MTRPDPPRLPRLTEVPPRELERLGLHPELARYVDAVVFSMFSSVCTLVEQTIGLIVQTVELGQLPLELARHAQAPAIAIAEVLTDKGMLQPEDLARIREVARDQFKAAAAARAVDRALAAAPEDQLRHALTELRAWIHQLGERNRDSAS